MIKDNTDLYDVHTKETMRNIEIKDLPRPIEKSLTFTKNYKDYWISITKNFLICVPTKEAGVPQYELNAGNLYKCIATVTVADERIKFESESFTENEIEEKFKAFTEKLLNLSTEALISHVLPRTLLS